MGTSGYTFTLHWTYSTKWCGCCFTMVTKLLDTFSKHKVMLFSILASSPFGWSEFGVLIVLSHVSQNQCNFNCLKGKIPTRTTKPYQTGFTVYHTFYWSLAFKDYLSFLPFSVVFLFIPLTGFAWAFPFCFGISSQVNSNWWTPLKFKDIKKCLALTGTVCN